LKPDSRCSRMCKGLSYAAVQTVNDDDAKSASTIVRYTDKPWNRLTRRWLERSLLGLSPGTAQSDLAVRNRWGQPGARY
jgi:hypothetical protein